MKRHLPWLLPLLLLMLIAPLTPWLDLTIEEHFFDRETMQFSSSPFFLWIYDWTVYPAQIVAVGATLLLGFSYRRLSLRRFTRAMLLLILPMIFGAGLITHAVLKDHWGRPRPRQVENFGGSEPFMPFYQPNISLAITHYKSFPCGHCTMGFYFFAVALLGRRLRCRWLQIAGMATALILGGLLGLARMAQGGHFFSDIVVAALVMWFTSLLADYLLFGEQEPEAQECRTSQEPLGG
jgi:membrane-associated PAP2 superfamily phosphatase